MSSTDRTLHATQNQLTVQCSDFFKMFIGRLFRLEKQVKQIPSLTLWQSLDFKGKALTNSTALET